MTLAEEHLAFKLNAVRVLCREATRRNYCAAFDSAMERAGLRGRDNHYGPWRAVPEIRGERTRRGFEIWKEKAEEVLYAAAKANGLRTYERTMIEVGFAPRDEVLREVTVRIEGSFSLPLKVAVMRGTTPMIERVRVQQLIRAAVMRGEVKWEVKSE